MWLLEWILFLLVQTVFQTLLYLLHKVKLNWGVESKMNTFSLKVYANIGQIIANKEL